MDKISVRDTSRQRGCEGTYWWPGYLVCRSSPNPSLSLPPAYCELFGTLSARKIHRCLSSHQTIFSLLCHMSPLMGGVGQGGAEPRDDCSNSHPFPVGCWCRRSPSWIRLSVFQSLVYTEAGFVGFWCMPKAWAFRRWSLLGLQVLIYTRTSCVYTKRGCIHQQGGAQPRDACSSRQLFLFRFWCIRPLWCIRLVVF